MRIASLVVLLTLSVVACGPEEEAPEPSPFVGQWYGTNSIASSGLGSPVTYNAHINVAVASGNNLIASAICPDGSGSVVFSAAGTSAAWTGRISCVVGHACGNDSPSVLMLNSASAEVTDGGTLVITATGSLSHPCVGDYSAGLAFYGRR